MPLFIWRVEIFDKSEKGSVSRFLAKIGGNPHRGVYRMMGMGVGWVSTAFRL